MPGGPNWKLEDDLKTVTVTFPSNPPVVWKIGVDQVDEALKNLREFRAMMQPEIPRAFAMGQGVMAISDPNWTSEPDAMQGQSLLHLRDPGFGWLHFLLPRHEAAKLGKLLQQQAEAPAPVQGSA